MKEVEIKRCPKCKRILLEFKEHSNNGGGLRIGLTRYYCESCKRTYDEEEVITSIIAKKISPAELLEERLKKEMLDLRTSDDKATDKTRQIADEVRLEQLDRWF